MVCVWPTHATCATTHYEIRKSNSATRPDLFRIHVVCFNGHERPLLYKRRPLVPVCVPTAHSSSSGFQTRVKWRAVLLLRHTAPPVHTQVHGAQHPAAQSRGCQRCERLFSGTAHTAKNKPSKREGDGAEDARTTVIVKSGPVKFSGGGSFLPVVEVSFDGGKL